MAPLNPECTIGYEKKISNIWIILAMSRDAGSRCLAPLTISNQVVSAAFKPRYSTAFMVLAGSVLRQKYTGTIDNILKKHPAFALSRAAG